MDIQALVHSFSQESAGTLFVLFLSALPVLILAAIVAIPMLQGPPVRPATILAEKERVVILGATSGVGKEMARMYFQRGARVCITGRRKKVLDDVVVELKTEAAGTAKKPSKTVKDLDNEKIIGIRADFSDVDEMVKLRTKIEQAWGGLDTLIIAAGVSALQPLMAVAGVNAEVKGTDPVPQSTAAGIQKVVDVAGAAVSGNYIGPMVAAVTFIPLLINASPSPSILLVSSLASVVPAPTRTLYGSTKAAALILFQSLSIEHPKIKWSYVCPSTIEGDFRKGAVDGGDIRETLGKDTLKKAEVAEKCIEAVDWGMGTVFMPSYMRYGHLAYWIYPSFIEKKARKKYNFN